MKTLRPKTERELKFKLNYLDENLVLDHPDVRRMLEGVMRENISAVGIMLKNEGKMKGFKDGMKLITDIFLSELPYDEMVLYIGKPISEWSFLTKEKLDIISSLNEVFKTYGQTYVEDKSDLMIFRKTLLYFIQNKLQKVNKYVDVTDILFALTDEYSYEDTLVNNGFNPILGEDGLPRMDRLTVDKERLVIVPIDDDAPWFEPRYSSTGELIPKKDL